MSLVKSSNLPHLRQHAWFFTNRESWNHLKAGGAVEVPDEVIAAFPGRFETVTQPPGPEVNAAGFYEDSAPRIDERGDSQ